jgi:adenosine deaminase
VFEGIESALRRGERELGISHRIILCFLRHLDEDSAFATLEAAAPYLDRIAGVGLDSSEVGHPPRNFFRVFAQAARLGLMRVAHAGEEGPPDYVFEALDGLRVDRIDHGNRSLEDDALVDAWSTSATDNRRNQSALAVVKPCVITPSGPCSHGD